MKVHTTTFFEGDALDVAQELIGSVIEHNGVSGMIVETEAYKRDPASHAYRITPRSEPMLKTHGKWYIYFTYGMYHCLNVTTNKGDVGAVLIRALEPLAGVDVMKRRRKCENIKNLTSGPAKLCIALDIDRSLNLTPIDGPIKLLRHKTFTNTDLIKTTRIGISAGKELPWRFYLKDNPFVSKK